MAEPKPKKYNRWTAVAVFSLAATLLTGHLWWEILELLPPVPWMHALWWMLVFILLAFFTPLQYFIYRRCPGKKGRWAQATVCLAIVSFFVFASAIFASMDNTVGGEDNRLAELEVFLRALFGQW